MKETDLTLAGALERIGQSAGDRLPVVLSPEVIGLLSEQLYRSPSKAVEELVVNGYDAGASEARVSIPNPPDLQSVVLVYDNGWGMNYQGLADLWTVGRSKVRADREGRRQIGKFGIGKLASYSVANRVTYVTKSSGRHFAVTIDFRDFQPRRTAQPTSVWLDVRNVDELRDLWDQEVFRQAIASIELDYEDLRSEESWTVVILEDLKQKVLSLHHGRLRWVLSTAMPLGISFKAYLNRDEVPSSKAAYAGIVEFKVVDLPQARVDALRSKTGDSWAVDGDRLTSPSFPSGIYGNVKVTKESLLGKSAEILRSEGFFVYVRERLVNEEDARFGLHELSHATLNRFRAEIHADDLDAALTANRESMEDTALYRGAQAVLNEVFNEARQRYQDWLRAESEKDQNAREDKRNWVPDRLVEYPVADALFVFARDRHGADADDTWMYLDVDAGIDVRELAGTLYRGSKHQRPYKYKYVSRGAAERLVRFAPSEATFIVNLDHDLVVAYSDEPAAQRLLEDVMTGEAMLEVYLREAGVSAGTIGDVLERRDLLLRSLANAKMFSLDGLSDFVRGSASRSSDLEVAIVAGARALGFVAKHLGGSGEPDGLARFVDFPDGEQTITLEAKSSNDKPSAKDIDFAALRTHAKKYNAIGCLLVAPQYPGGESGNVATAADGTQTSCWTVGQYADVIQKAEARHISARDVLKVVTTCFTPAEVSNAVGALLSKPSWEKRALYLEVVRVLREVHDLLTDSARNTMMVASHVVLRAGFEGVQEQDVSDAVRDIAAVSRGGLTLRDGNIVLNVDYDELERRVQTLTGEPASSRRQNTFAERLTADSIEKSPKDAPT